MSSPRLSLLGVLASASVSSACATALSGFQPAHVPDKGHVQAEAGVDVPIPTGAIAKSADAASELEELAETRTLTESEKQTIIEGAVNLAVSPPIPLAHVGAAYAPVESWEVGVRYAAAGWRLGVRRQILRQEVHGIDLTLGLGGGRAAIEPPVDNVLDTIEIEDFVRWNFDVPITLGKHGSWYRWWTGPRFVYSSMSQAMTLTLPGESRELASISGDAFYVGGYFGAAFGYRAFFIGPELTLVELFGSAEVRALDTTQDVDITTFIVYPALAVIVEI